MVYTVIGDYKKLLPEIITEEGSGIGSPFSLFPEELKKYIKEPKNEESRLSRLGGYLLLFHTVRFLLGEIEFDIAFNEHGKPYFESEKMKNITFNISHSDGLCAVAVCEDGCKVGVDIQGSVDKEKEERLSNRFFGGSFEEIGSLESLYIFGGFSAYGDCMFAEIPSAALKSSDHDRSFVDRWSLCEALMKCDGRGFAAYTEIGKLSENASAASVNFSYKGREYSITTAVQ